MWHPASKVSFHLVDALLDLLLGLLKTVELRVEVLDGARIIILQRLDRVDLRVQTLQVLAKSLQNALNFTLCL